MTDTTVQGDVATNGTTRTRSLWWATWLPLALTLIVGLSAIDVWYTERAETVINVPAEGKIVEVVFLVGGNTTILRTTNGTYDVIGYFPGNEGRAVRIEERKDGRQLACDTAASVCMPIARNSYRPSSK